MNPFLSSRLPRPAPSRTDGALGTILVIGALATGACAPEASRDAVFPDPDPDRPRPILSPTADFEAAEEADALRVPEIETESEELAARAEALRARADAIGAPVLTPDERRRLEAAQTPSMGP